MVSEDRQRVIETNRSLRLIKNELESLLEKGVIDDDAFDSIHRLLPTEASLSGAPTPASRTAARAPQRSPAPAPSASPPTNALENLNLRPTSSAATSTSTAPPPSYNQSTGGGGPPALPGRTPPPPAPGKPVIAHARALYRYAGADAGDCAFERGDGVAVHQYMNADWWLGRNLRTGQEGIFPRSYVEIEAAPPPPGPPPGGHGNYYQQQQQQPWQDEKAGYGGGGGGGGGYPGAAPYGGAPQQPMYGGYPPPPPGQANPYDANAPPPMAVAEQGGEGGSKMGEQGKKIGKKLGNAAIFGAGATIGSNIVNSIF
ncbi:SH3-domain-containing protein [Phialemonium atrogriseum]|uniref:SH3-domain-containing protein n=1 Tax=Phialemonium atrogriseum TaxID=1093897 RepID=A0AAJ0FE96_9PEZI|nr:SH3-domain-containing protein [Phialemonium atrogriseum]KAK1764097.1 SH3-domain-containing protein [Phialemonium atrogriseum]